MEQPRLVDAPPKEKISIPPVVRLKAQIIALRHGISLAEAVDRILSEEIEEKRQERKQGHAP